MVGFLVGFLVFEFLKFKHGFRHFDWYNQSQRSRDVFERIRASSGGPHGHIYRHFWFPWWSGFWWNFVLMHFVADPPVGSDMIEVVGEVSDRAGVSGVALPCWLF